MPIVKKQLLAVEYTVAEKMREDYKNELEEKIKRAKIERTVASSKMKEAEVRLEVGKLDSLYLNLL